MLSAHIDRIAADGVTHAEIMVSRLLAPPGEGASDGGLCDRFRAVRDTADRASNGRVDVVLLAAIGRGTRARAEKQIEKVLCLAKAGLIHGLAVAGDERACTIASIADLLHRVKDAGLGLEIHAGECSGPENVRDALCASPDRLGHALGAFEDQNLIEELCVRDVHLEFCPTSNVRLGQSVDLGRHPIRRAHEIGMNFGISTDNPGPLECTLRSELELLRRELGFGDEDLERMQDNAWRSRFGPRLSDR